MKTEGMPIMGSLIPGSSAVIAPDGRLISEVETMTEEKLIIAELDLSLVTKAKTFADASGHCEYCCSFWVIFCVWELYEAWGVTLYAGSVTN